MLRRHLWRVVPQGYHATLPRAQRSHLAPQGSRLLDHRTRARQPARDHQCVVQCVKIVPGDGQVNVLAVGAELEHTEVPPAQVLPPQRSTKRVQNDTCVLSPGGHLSASARLVRQFLKDPQQTICREACLASPREREVPKLQIAEKLSVELLVIPHHDELAEPMVNQPLRKLDLILIHLEASAVIAQEYDLRSLPLHCRDEPQQQLVERTIGVLGSRPCFLEVNPHRVVDHVVPVLHATVV